MKFAPIRNAFRSELVFSAAFRVGGMMIGFGNNVLLAQWMSPQLLGASAAIVGLASYHQLFSQLNQDNNLIRLLRPAGVSAWAEIQRQQMARVLRSLLGAVVFSLLAGLAYELTWLQIGAAFLYFGATSSMPWWVLGVKGDYRPQYVTQFAQSAIVLLTVVLVRLSGLAPVAGIEIVMYGAAASLGCVGIYRFLGLGRSLEVIPGASRPPRIAPSYSLLLSGALITIYSASDLLIVAKFCSQGDAGIYRVGAGLVGAVNGLWLVAQANVYPRLVGAGNEPDAWISTRGLGWWLIGAVGLLGLAIGCALAMEMILGARYRGILPVVAILALAKTFSFGHAFFGLRIYAAGRNREALYSHAVAISVGIGSALLLLNRWGMYGVAVGFLLGEVAMMMTIVTTWLLLRAAALKRG